MQRHLVLVVVSLLALDGTAAAQAVQAAPGMPQVAQPRDKPPAKAGTATIQGRIVAAETGTAVRRATVSLAPANPLEARTTTTDMDGRYQFADLPAGSYRVTGSKGLYVSLEYGQRRFYERGTPVEVTDGQKVEGIDIALPRGAVIAGALMDDAGDPAAGVRVSAMRQQFRSGKRTLVNTGRSVETNDRGEYRLYGLPPGTYYVAALPASANPVIPMLSTPSGAPTYYPGTLNQLEAQRVAARVGQESVVPDFTLVASRLAKITGTATGPSGAPAQAVMLMSTAQVPAGETALPGMSMAMVQPDGGFRLNNVPPGEYTLLATWVNLGSGEQQVSSMPLTVAGEDIAGIALTTSPGFQAKGQILFDEGAPPAGLSASSLMLVAAPASQSAMTGAIGRAIVRDDWTFTASGLAGERRFAFAQGLPTGWMVKSVFNGSTDITDKPLNVTEDVDRIVITVTRRGASLSGLVTDAAGKPAGDATVVLFPDDTALGPPHSQRYVRALRPGDDGRFKAQQLPAAMYLMVAVDALEPGGEYDPELLEQLRPQATRVVLGWGDQSEVQLRVTKFERR